MPRPPIRAAVLVVRIWREETGRTGLRARILESRDVARAELATTAAGSVDEICAIVKAWAERFARAGDDERP